MLDRLTDFFLSHPKAVVALGEALLSLSSALVMFGACANAGTGVVAAFSKLGHQVRPEPRLADLLPGWPTWWIPESFDGFVFVIAIGIVGALLVHSGRQLERFLDS